MAVVKHSNFFSTTLATPPTGTTEASFNVTSATNLPTLAAGDWCYVVLKNASLTREVIKIGTISGVTLTPAAGGRGADGSAAYASWLANDVIELCFVNASLLDLLYGFKEAFYNTAKTFKSIFTNTNTAARTYTFSDRDGNVITDADINLTAVTPADADKVAITVAGLIKHVTWANLKATLGSWLQDQTATAFTTGGAAPNFTLTPLPAPAALTANLRFRVKFHAAGAGSDVLDIAGLGNKSLKQYDSTGAKVGAVLALNQLVDLEYDGVDLVVLDPLPPVVSVKQIQTVQATVASNAMTLSLAATTLDFRSPTLGSGVVNTRIVPSTISLVVPSGATLATVDAVQNRLLLLAIDNAGTVELAVVNLAGGNNLDETGIINTTAISAGATANNVVYSTTGRTGVPYRIVGVVESTQATAGTWATAPSTIQGYGGQALSAMSAIGFGQTIQNLIGTRTSGTTYYNTTGRPIFVSVSSGANGATFTVGGVVVHGFSATVATNAAAIIPPGVSYIFSSGTINQWVELR